MHNFETCTGKQSGQASRLAGVCGVVMETAVVPAFGTVVFFSFFKSCLQVSLAETLKIQIANTHFHVSPIVMQ